MCVCVCRRAVDCVVVSPNTERQLVHWCVPEEEEEDEEEQQPRSASVSGGGGGGGHGASWKRPLNFNGVGIHKNVHTIRQHCANPLYVMVA